MAEKKEQEKPLAHRIDVDGHEDVPVEFTSRRRQKCIKCCGCSVAVTLILLVAILILMLTVLHVKDPLMKLNSVKINGVDSLSRNPTPTDRNLTLVADVSLKNPNAASFKFDNTTTYVYYGGSVVGEARTPAGRVGARRTIGVSVVVDVMVDKIVEVKRFGSDWGKGILGFSTDTRMSGKVKITNVSKKSVVVEMKCTMNVNVSTKAIQDSNCGTTILL